MSRHLASTQEFRHFSGELAAADGREFERRALPLVRIVWSDAVGTPALRSFDKAGVDHLVWSDATPHPLIVQCKGFQRDTQELGESQLRQCRKSIDSFRKSGLRASTYILLHNRDSRNREFCNAIKCELAKLVSSHQVTTAELWDRRRLLRAVADTLYNHVHTIMRERNASMVQMHLEAEPLLGGVIKSIPYRTSELLFDKYQLRSESTPREQVADPVADLSLFEERRISIVIGEAGFGKTTTALRALGSTGNYVMYVPAAAISSRTANTKSFLKQCFDFDDFMENVAESDLPVVRPLVLQVLKYILRTRETNNALILDGLDESIFFSRRGGVQHLMNILNAVQVPIVLTARSEYWHVRKTDFAGVFGCIASSKSDRHTDQKDVRLVELLPWDDSQIVGLARQYRQQITEPDAKSRLDTLIATIESGEYRAYYGDIPRRPLFLRFILETVAEGGVHHVSRAQLFEEWVRMKVTRDIVAPMKWGGKGRAAIVDQSESADRTLELSFLAMRCAASVMTRVTDGSLELLPNCELNAVLASDEQLKSIADPAGLVLNSLLIPSSSRSAVKPLRVEFAHRTLQEFFLARHLREHAVIGQINVPESVKQWVDDLDTAGL